MRAAKKVKKNRKKKEKIKEMHNKMEIEKRRVDKCPVHHEKSIVE